MVRRKTEVECRKLRQEKAIILAQNIPKGGKPPKLSIAMSGLINFQDLQEIGKRQIK